MWLATRGSKAEARVLRRRRISLFITSFLLIYVLGAVVYFGIYYHATDHAKSFLTSTTDVSVNRVESGFMFDGPGTDRALIFYPGAKVEETAYAELMSRLARGGIDCFLVKMPLHMAFMGRGKAAGIMATYDYDKWYISGHSLGGAIAALYCAEHGDEFDGMALLASYSTMDIRDDLPMVSIVASNDHVLQWDVYEANQINNPPDAVEVMIEGGNHCQFGDYGFQKGDGTATISREEQLSQVTEAILEMSGE